MPASPRPVALTRRAALLAAPFVAGITTLSLVGAGSLQPAHADRQLAAAPAAAPAPRTHVPRSAPADPAIVSAVTSAFGKAFKHVPGHVEGYADVEGVGNVLDQRGESVQAPASTTKLFTTGTALLTMGPNYRFATTVVRTGSDGTKPAAAGAVSAGATSAGATSAGATSAGSGIIPEPSASATAAATPTADPSATASATASATGSRTDSASPSGTPTVAPAPVYLAADRSGTLHGDLVLVGAGDPSFSSANLLALARSVRAAGVRKVQGGLYLDDRILDQVRGAKGWKSDYVGGESGVLSGLMVDSNLRSGSRSYRANPSPYNLALFVADLKKAGVKITGKAQVGRSPKPVTATVAVHTSAPLSSIVKTMDKNSINTWAEELLKDIGAHVTGTGSTAAGLSVERATAASFGLTLSTLADGSGLSTLDRMTAQQEVSWLEAMDTTSIGPVLRAALPVSCKDGTLAGRLCGAWLTGRIHAKTGTLDHTANLAGYTTTRTGKRVWFSLLADQTNDGSARAAIDAVAASLSRSGL